MSAFSFFKNRLTHRKQRTNATLAKDSYTYTPLQDNEIRLLRLCPGAAGSPIACSLQIVNLFDYDDINGWAKGHTIRSYDTISYVWGCTKSTFEIGCDGKTTVIGAGLRDALRRLRDPYEVRILWADALCINQQDDVERANQIKLMGLIYWKAQKVHIWLGPGKNKPRQRACSSTSAVDLIRKLGEPSRESSTLGVSAGNPKPHVCGLKADTKYHDRRQWEDLSDMFQRPWFRRVWVVQELGLSKDATFYYGQSSFTREELKDFLAYLYARAYDNIQRYHLDLRILRIADHYQDTTRWGHRLEYGSDPSLAESFLGVLERARGLQCTDPRDGIYAFLGHPAAFKQFLLDDEPFMWYPRNYNSGKQTFIKPDYTRANTLAQLYLDVALTAIRKLPDGLEILSYVAHIKETLDEQFSSWIPRWDLGGEPSLFYGPYTFYRVSGTLQPTTLTTALADESYGTHQLRLKALPLGSIQLKHPDPTSASFARIAYEFLTNPDALLKHCADKTYDKNRVWRTHNSDYISPNTLAFTLTAGYTSTKTSHRPAEEDPQNHFSMFRAYLRGMGVRKKRSDIFSVDKDDEASQFAQQLQRVATGRAFFCTFSGYLGLGPALLQEGDEVWLAMGAKMPFVFRRVGVGIFKILGQTYLHGVMRGEAVAGLTEDDFQTVTLC